MNTSECKTVPGHHSWVGWGGPIAKTKFGDGMNGWHNKSAESRSMNAKVYYVPKKQIKDWMDKRMNVYVFFADGYEWKTNCLRCVG